MSTAELPGLPEMDTDWDDLLGDDSDSGAVATPDDDEPMDDFEQPVTTARLYGINLEKLSEREVKALREEIVTSVLRSGFALTQLELEPGE